MEGTEQNSTTVTGSIPDTARQIVTDPATFYRNMPKTGGFADPMLFLAAMMVVVAIISTAMSFLGLGPAGGVPAGARAGTGLMAVIISPIIAVIFSFIPAAVMWIIWKLMGSDESYETAYRCIAYASAISPITTLAGILPYVGGAIGVLWGVYLMIVSSVETHGVAQNTAYIVFGILGALMLFSSISTEMTARSVGAKLEEMGIDRQSMEEMSPEEAGKAVGEFLKGLQKAAEQNDN